MINLVTFSTFKGHISKPTNHKLVGTFFKKTRFFELALLANKKLGHNALNYNGVTETCFKLSQ